MTELSVDSIKKAIEGIKLRCAREQVDILTTKYVITGDVRKCLHEQGYDTDEKISAYLKKLCLEEHK